MKRTSSRVFVASGVVCAVLLMVPLVLDGWQRYDRRPINPSLSLAIVDEMAPASRNDRAAVAAENERELRMDVQRLYALASELKDEVNQSNSQLVLNVSLVRRAHDIEKIAKQIRDRARH